MEKKTLSGGGGGSHGKAVSFLDALVAELRGTEIPLDAICAADLAERLGCSCRRALAMLDGKVKSGAYKKHFGKRPGDGHAACWFWPARLG
jgi:hypothetical protein